MEFDAQEVNPVNQIDIQIIKKNLRKGGNQYLQILEKQPREFQT